MLLVTVDVTNANPGAAYVDSVTATVTLANKYVLPPLSQDLGGAMVPARATATMPALAMSVPWSTVPGLTGDIAANRGLGYRVHGTVKFRIIRGKAPITRDFDEQGVLSQQDLARAVQQSAPLPIPTIPAPALPPLWPAPR